MLLKLFLTFMKIGVFTFGSGYAMLALAQKEIVEINHWLTPRQFADAVSLSEITPGPIMVNLATFVGTELRGIPGAVAATLGLIIPPMAALIIVTQLYIDLRDNTIVQKFFKGIRPAVIGLIATVIIKLGKTALVDYKSVLIALLVIAGVFIGIHPIITVVAAAILGLVVF